MGRLLVPGAGFAEIVDCKRCHIHYAVSSAPLASAFLGIRMGPPAEDAFVSHGCEPHWLNPRSRTDFLAPAEALVERARALRAEALTASQQAAARRSSALNTQCYA